MVHLCKVHVYLTCTGLGPRSRQVSAEEHFTVALSVAAQVASLRRMRAVTLRALLKSFCKKSKGRANGDRPRAANQALLGTDDVDAAGR